MLMGLLGILLALALLIGMAYRGWSVLLLAPAAALVAAGVAGEPVLAHWTQTFMPAAAGFLAQFFPIFLLGALFGKLMDDSGSVRAISAFMAEKMGPRHAILAVVLAGAFVTYGGVSLFVAFFVLAPMAHSLFKAANIPNHLMPAAIVLGTSTFTMSALPGTPSIQNAIPMPFFGTTPFAAPGLGVIASLIMMGFGMWWLGGAAAQVWVMKRSLRRRMKRQPTMHWCVSAQSPRMSLTRRKWATENAAQSCPPCGRLRCRWWWWWRSTW